MLLYVLCIISNLLSCNFPQELLNSCKIFLYRFSLSISNLFGFSGPHIVYDQMLNRFLNVLISIISALSMSSTVPLPQFSYPKLDHHAHFHIVLLLFLFFHLNLVTGYSISLINSLKSYTLHYKLSFHEPVTIPFHF